ncbi:MAG: fasciclin domain-containing protein [Erythrobacter sp.]|nr:fasciclin domain-containing protein [Erythrobacter sp.]
MKNLSLALVSAASLVLAACGSPAEDETTATADETAMADQMANADRAPGTVVEVAQGNPDFSALVSAVSSAGLGDTLTGEGPFTVFAPTNAAFENVPQGTRDELMSPAGREDLSSILTYHMVEGRTDAAALTRAIEAAGSDGYAITTVNGATLTAMMDGNDVVLEDATGNTARVTQTDLDASNGVIHVIDTVLMPE